jgi:hypothetical protein
MAVRLSALRAGRALLLLISVGVRGNVQDKVLYYKPEGRGFETR